ncbi:MAG: PA0069 family radical SAM protein [Thiohalospira sp.]
MGRRHDPHKGRGAVSSPDNRYAAWQREAVDDGWRDEPDPDTDWEPAPATTLIPHKTRRIVTYNDSPDLAFDRTVNPYRGCEHGCIYCYARPTHAWLDESPGRDFETRIHYRPDAAERLRAELDRPGYRPETIALGMNTDAYQPAERRLEITRALLEVCRQTRHPVSLVTKSALVERDRDILGPMAEAGLATVAVSITTLDGDLNRRLEPRAAGPRRRLTTIRRLREAGIPVGVLVAPVIPVLTEAEFEAILEAAAEAGASWAGYVLLRLPHELGDLFRDWLAEHAPGEADHILSRVQQARGGKDYEPRFGQRMTGEGPWADLLAQRFRLARRKFGLEWPPVLDTGAFTPPGGRQGDLFD